MNAWFSALLAATAGETDLLAEFRDQSWDELLSQVQREELEGLLYHCCISNELQVSQLDLLGRRYRRTARKNTIALQELGGVLEQLKGKGLELIVLPGASLLPLYPDSGCRPMDDVDLLAPPGGLRQLRAELRDLGFSNSPRHEDLMVRGSTVFDLHDDVVNCARISTRRHAGWMDERAVWERSMVSTVEGIKILTLCHEDTVLYTVLHALRHGYSRITWFFDLHFLLQESINWEALMSRARGFHLARPLLYCLYFARRQLSFELPPSADEWVESFAFRPGEKVIMRRALEDRGEGEWGDLLWSFNVTGQTARLLFLAQTLFPTPAVLLQVFPYIPRILFPLAYPLRVGQLILRAGGQLVIYVRKAWRSFRRPLNLV